MKRYLLVSLWVLAFGLQAEDFSLVVWVNPPSKLPPFVGHTWLQVSSEGASVSYENNWGMKRNKARPRKDSINYSWRIDEAIAHDVIDAMEGRIASKSIYDLQTNNCVHLVINALQIASIPHPDFLTPLGMPAPHCLYKYITLLNKGYTFGQITAKYLSFPYDYTPVGSKNSFGNY